MVAIQDLRAVAEAAARTGLRPTEVVGALVEPMTGADGDALLRVVITVPDEQFDDIDGSHFLSALLNVKREIREAGDERRVVVDYDTPSERDDRGDP